MKKHPASLYFPAAILIALVFGAVCLDATELIAETNSFAYAVAEFEEDAQDGDQSGSDIASCLGGSSGARGELLAQHQSALTSRSGSASPEQTNDSAPFAVTGRQLSTQVEVSPGVPHLADRLHSYGLNLLFSGLSPPHIS